MNIFHFGHLSSLIWWHLFQKSIGDYRKFLLMRMFNQNIMSWNSTWELWVASINGSKSGGTSGSCKPEPPTDRGISTPHNILESLWLPITETHFDMPVYTHINYMYIPTNITLCMLNVHKTVVVVIDVVPSHVMWQSNNFVWRN